MSQLNSRPTRSRRSSPFVSSQRNPNSSPATAADSSRKRTFMDKWTEPPIPAPLPSFAEAGMERHGVVANMAPLGTRPSAKAVKSSAKSEAADTNGSRCNGVPDVMNEAFPSLSTMPQETTEASESTSNVLRQRSPSTITEDLEPVPPSTPQQPRSARKSVPRSSVAPSSVRNESEGSNMYATSPVQCTPLPQQSPSVAASASHASKVNYTYDEGDAARQKEGRARAEANATMLRKAAMLRTTARMVELAVSEAIEGHHWCTAYALRELYDEDPEGFGNLAHRHASEEASEQENSLFYRLMTMKKKEGRKDKTAEYYFNGDGSDPAPYRPRRRQAPIAPAPQPMVYQPFNPIFQTVRSTYASPYAKPYTSIYAAPPPPPRQPPSTNRDALVKDGVPVEPLLDAQSSSTTVPQRKQGEPAFHPNKKHKANSFTSTNEGFNGSLLAASTTAVDEIPKKQQNGVTSASSSGAILSSSPAKLSGRPRALSISSSSSLSSVDEEILDNDGYTPMDFEHVPNSAGTTKPSDGFEHSKGRGIVGAGKTKAKAKFGASVSTETHSNAGGPAKQKQPTKSKDLSKTESNTFSFKASKANKKSQDLNKSKTSSPAPPSFSAINIPTRSHNTNTNSSARVDNDNNQANPSMAPESIRTSSSSSVASAPILKPVKKPKLSFKKKGQAAERLYNYEESELVGKWKRKAREMTNGVTEEMRTESFERPNMEPSGRATPPASARPLGYTSDGGDSISMPTVSATTSGRPAKAIRLVNKNERASRRQTTSASVNNYDSEMSSPTGLGFQPDLPPGSLPSSRAGTPSSHRPSRKAKNGIGLRVKTS